MERYAIIEDDYVLFENDVILSLKTNKFVGESISNKGYIVVWISNKRKLLHRLIAEAFIANPDNKPFIDHVDRNRMNNNLGNLRWCTASENNCNRRMLSNNKTGETCITKCTMAGIWYWHVRVRAHDERRIKYFPCQESDTVIPDYVIMYRDDMKNAIQGEFVPK